MARIAIFGAGYVGLVTGACFADLGHEVVVRDVLPERIERLRAGEVPIYEPGLDEVLERSRDRISFTLDVGEAVDGAEFLYVAVGTPPTYSGDADLSAVWTVVDELPEHVPGRPLVVMKSTVPVGTGARVRARLDARGLDNVGYVSNPEFTAEGTAVRDFMEPDRVVIGAFEEADGDAVERLHAGIDAPVVRAEVSSAELIKLAANAFLVTRISFINEIANVCELVGADVTRVAEGIGLDHRLGPHFLRAGLGWGGSCLAADETVLVRDDWGTRLTSLERLFDSLPGEKSGGLARPDDLEVLAWRAGHDAPEWFTVAAVTRRRYRGEAVDVRTKMGRRVRCTADHPFVVREGLVRRADELTEDDWLPLAQGLPDHLTAPMRVPLLADDVDADAVIVRPEPSALAALGARGLQQVLEHPRGRVARSHDIVRAGAMRLRELRTAGLPLEGSSLATTTNGTYVPAFVRLDEDFWRVVGLYLAEGHCSRDGRRLRLQWSFHPSDELDLVEEVAGFWRLHGVRADIRFLETTTAVSVSSRLLGDWWLSSLRLGRNCYEQRLPDLIWNAPAAHKRALLAAAWRGDGSWSYVNGGPSVVLEYGTVSRELADGMLRLLGELGVTASQRVGRAVKSTCDTYWLRISGADQVESLLDFVPPQDREEIRSSLGRQAKRIAPTGYRTDGNAAWVRVVEAVRRPYDDDVYSLEVPGAHTFVTTGGLVVHNCFPKDSLALKQLAANSGYHFQLLNAVIEVNELQMRRVVQKLQQRLGNLRGRTIALLGLAFKPNTDDMREAPSRVIAYRLLAEGAVVRAWDPIARPGDLEDVEICDSVLAAVRDADAAVIVTEWPQLRELATAEVRDAMARPLVIDGRNLLDPAAAAAAGFEYEGIGRPTHATPDRELQS